MRTSQVLLIVALGLVFAVPLCVGLAYRVVAAEFAVAAAARDEAPVFLDQRAEDHWPHAGEAAARALRQLDQVAAEVEALEAMFPDAPAAADSRLLLVDEEVPQLALRAFSALVDDPSAARRALDELIARERVGATLAAQFEIVRTGLERSDMERARRVLERALESTGVVDESSAWAAFQLAWLLRAESAGERALGVVERVLAFADTEVDPELKFVARLSAVRFARELGRVGRAAALCDELLGEIRTGPRTAPVLDEARRLLRRPR